MPRIRPVAVAVAVAGLVAGCGGYSSPKVAATTVPVADAGATVSLKNIAFNPGSVTIRAGQAVVWSFDDGSVPHNVSGQGFASTIRSSGSYRHTFDTPGTYRYTCTIHSGMNGTVVVSQ